MDILRTIIKQTKHLIDVVCIALLKILQTDFLISLQHIFPEQNVEFLY